MLFTDIFPTRLVNFMNRVLAFVVLLSLVFQANGTLVSFMLFSGNRVNIASSCCERKTADCRGRCFLNKVIANGDQSRETHASVIVMLDAGFEAIIQSTSTHLTSSSIIVHPSSLIRCPREGHGQVPAPPPRFV